MKYPFRVLLGLLSAVLWYTVLPWDEAYAGSTPDVYIDDVRLQQEHVVMKDNRIFIAFTDLVQLREGLDMEWNHVNKEIEITGPKTYLVITVGKSTVIKDEEQLEMDAEPFIHEGKTMVPLRFASEALGREIKWVKSEQTAYVSGGSTDV